jgi:hypothetical protein
VAGLLDDPQVHPSRGFRRPLLTTGGAR